MQSMPVAAEMDLEMFVLVHAALKPATCGHDRVAGGPVEAGGAAGGSCC